MHDATFRPCKLRLKFFSSTPAKRRTCCIRAVLSSRAGLYHGPMVKHELHAVHAATPVSTRARRSVKMGALLIKELDMRKEPIETEVQGRFTMGGAVRTPRERSRERPELVSQRPSHSKLVASAPAGEA